MLGERIDQGSAAGCEIRRLPGVRLGASFQRQFAPAPAYQDLPIHCWKSLAQDATFPIWQCSLTADRFPSRTGPVPVVGSVAFCHGFVCHIACIRPTFQTILLFSGYRTCEISQYVIDCRQNTRIALEVRWQSFVRRDAHNRFATVIRLRGLQRSVLRRQYYLRDPRHRRPCHLLQ
jgi:hypothetical protein